MQAPLLRLNADAWSLITPHLDFDDVKSLLLVGVGHLSKVVGSATQSLVINKLVHSAVDLESILLTAKATPNLQHLIIEPAGLRYAVMKPLLPLSPSIFPPILKTLDATFDNSLAFFMVTHNIAELAPCLTSLSLSGGTVDNAHNLRNLKLPPLLQKLVFAGALITLEDGDIATLPRSLTHLDIRVNAVPSLTENEWPQLSTLLLLFDYETTLFIEHLPRTLTELTLAGTLATSFKPTVSESYLAFPWRVFFPYLAHLSLNSHFGGPATDIYRSILLPNVYYTNEVSDFLTRGFWRSPLLDRTPDTGYPLFKCLQLHTDTLSLDAMRMLAPLLRDLTTFHNPHYDQLQHLPSVISFSSHGEFKYTSNSPKHLKHVWLSSIEVGAIGILESLETLFLYRNIACDTTALKDVRWPSTLETLKVGMPFDAPAIESLPTTLTCLDVRIPTYEAWSMISSRLVNLTQLQIQFSPGDWHNSERLAPISSRLTDFKLTYAPGSSPKGPQLDEIFGSNSILPSSLQTISITSEMTTHIIPLSLIANLPPSLRALNLSGYMTFNSKTENSDASLSSTKTPSELFGSLPATLETLFLSPITDPSFECLKDVSTLSSLPRGLKGFGQIRLFAAPESSEIDALINNLPSRLVFLVYQGQQLSLAPVINVSEAYFSKRRSYLYRGPEAPTTASMAQ